LFFLRFFFLFFLSFFSFFSLKFEKGQPFWDKKDSRFGKKKVKKKYKKRTAVGCNQISIKFCCLKSKYSSKKIWAQKLIKNWPKIYRKSTKNLLKINHKFTKYLPKNIKNLPKNIKNLPKNIKNLPKNIKNLPKNIKSCSKIYQTFTKKLNKNYLIIKQIKYG